MLWENLYMAINSLKTNKLRTVLTMLGMIIGVAAVIAMVSVGMGMSEQVQKTLAGLGKNQLFVLPGAVLPSGVRIAAGSITTLTMQDARAIVREIPGVSMAAPSISRQFQVVYGNKNWLTSVQGTTPEFAAVRNYQLEQGQLFTYEDVGTRARVAVLGEVVARELFGNISPLGAAVRINNAPFRVVGVLAAKGMSPIGHDQDDMVIIPVTTAQERVIGVTHLSSLSVTAVSADDMERIQEEIRNLLRARHRLQPGALDDFTVSNTRSLNAARMEASNTLTLFLGNIAAISLLVGGIGIMNIMLVSVTERTHEIGLRKALGASFGDILQQFLIEAVVISVAGGGIGVGLGIAAARVISTLAGWNTVVSPPAVLLVLGFSLVLGLFFGIYPARKAALLDPIEALRSEGA